MLLNFFSKNTSNSVADWTLLQRILDLTLDAFVELVAEASNGELQIQINSKKVGVATFVRVGGRLFFRKKAEQPMSTAQNFCNQRLQKPPCFSGGSITPLCMFCIS